MECTPAVRLVELYDAMPEPFKLTVPRAVEPSLKVIVPVGTPEPDAGVTVAVRVMLAPRFAGLAEAVTLVDVASMPTLTETTLDVEAT
jgi:hypothetical protein